MKELLGLYESQSNLTIEIGHNSIADWCVTIYDRKGVSLKDARTAVSVQDCDYKLAMAKAYVALCEYLIDVRGGY